MNINHKKFHCYLNIHFRSLLEAVFLDVNEKQMKNKIGYIGTLTIFFIAAIGSFYSYFNAEQLSISPIFALAYFFGLQQVNNIAVLILNKKKLIKYFIFASSTFANTCVQMN